MRRYRVRFHHAAAAAQSYRGSCELPASPASKGWRDALATTFLSHSRHQARTRLRVKAPRGDHCACGAASSKAAVQRKTSRLLCEGPPPPRTPRCLPACKSTRVMAASSRQRPRVAARLAESLASHTWRAATDSSRGEESPSLPQKRGEDPQPHKGGWGNFPPWGGGAQQRTAKQSKAKQSRASPRHA
jgi:hypothetical protein